MLIGSPRADLDVGSYVIRSEGRLVFENFWSLRVNWLRTVFQRKGVLGIHLPYVNILNSRVHNNSD